MSNCSNCGKTSFIRDDDTGYKVCSSCGAIQSFDQYEAQIGGINGPQGTFVRVGTYGSGTDYSYRDRKLYAATNSIEDLTNRLGLTSKNFEIKNMISKITESEFGQGDWFQVLIGACGYVVMRNDNRPLPMAEIADVVGCDVYELGKMIMRVIDFLELRKCDFPEFDIVYSLERTIKNSRSFAAVERSLLERIRKQGIFLLQCAVKWFFSTGRRPLPLVVAVLVLVAEVNQVEIRMEDLAKEVCAVVSTCRTRYKELLEQLVKVAQVLPWGKNINTKNVVKNASFVIQYMEKKSMSKPVEKRKNPDPPRLDFTNVVTDCLRKDDVEDSDSDRASIKDVDSLQKDDDGDSNDDRTIIKDLDSLRISPECLSMMYEKFLKENRPAKHSRSVQKRRKLGLDIPEQECREWWNGKSEMSRKLILKHLLEKDVGLDTMPPSFVAGQLKCKMRRERINAAKRRIRKITHPLDADLGDTANLVADSTGIERRKKRKGRVVGDIDWEDLIIETLILHQVKEEEIEKGHYNTLLGLYVFNSGIV